MNPIPLKLRSDLPRASRLVEQGLPVHPMPPEQIPFLRLLDEDGRAVPASIEPDGRDEHGRVVWVRVTAAVETAPGVERQLRLESGDQPAAGPQALIVTESSGVITVATSAYSLTLTDPGGIRLETESGALLDGCVGFQLWPDARSIVGAGAGTCRLADFVPQGWSIQERSETRCLALLIGRVPKFAPYTTDPTNLDPAAQFDCELEMICCAFSPVIRLRWRIENHTVWQAYLERYALALPLASGANVADGERSQDGKFIRWVTAAGPGGMAALTAGFVDALGPGAGISVERRGGVCDLTLEQVARHARDGVFEPHRYLASEHDDGRGLDAVVGGINPPFDANMTAQTPQVHRLFYLGMGRTFEASILVNCHRSDIEAELNPVYFQLESDHYSRTGALPENGDPVCFGEFREQVFEAAEWLLRRQWKGTLWWGEWWREWDTYRKQGIESTANGNSPLGPLYHYWRTGDPRFIDCAKRSMEFVYDVQLSKRRGGLGPFFQCRRFLIDKMEWVHMRYQRIEGPIKAAHFFGDRRLRTKIIDAMRTYAENLVCPNGAPGYGSGGPAGKRVPAGADCTNFQETLVICWRETGEERFLELAQKMARSEIRHMAKWECEIDIGIS